VRVGFLTRYDRRRASSRVRAYQYEPYLAAVGVDTRYLPWANRPARAWPRYVARALALARWADVLVLQKPFHRSSLIDALARINNRMIVDVDDAIWEPGTVRSGEHTAKRGRRLRHAVERAGVATVGNAYTAAWIREQCPDVLVYVVPSSVDFSSFPTRSHVPSRPAVVGWIGSPENLGDLTACQHALRRMVEEGAINMRVVSSRPADLPGLPTEFVPWSLSTEAEQVAAFDIGVMPLHDTPRTRGRCGFKAIEYMAAGLPTVASPVSGPCDVIEHGVTGYLARDEHEWRAWLAKLAADAGLRTSLGMAARQAVRDHYCYESNAPRMAQILVDRTASGDARVRTGI
jgi:glycosyltransferase involved in cell wall biosynthesis